MVYTRFRAFRDTFVTWFVLILGRYEAEMVVCLAMPLDVVPDMMIGGIYPVIPQRTEHEYPVWATL